MNDNKERIQKIISNYGSYSRREVERLIKAKRVTLNGKTVSLGEKASIDDLIKIDGKIVKFKTKHYYYLVNKPKGYIASRIDDMNKRVIDLVPNPSNRNLFTIGRLDVNTTGLIIVTTDGKLSDLVNSPKSKVAKTYLVWLSHPLVRSDFAKIREGITLDDGVVTKPVKKVKVINNTQKNYLVKMTIYEGKKNQIRRMFKELNNEVINLKRIQIGLLVLDNNLESGKYRRIQKEEMYEALKQTYK